MSESQEIRWNGSLVEVTARLVPRRAYFTASIDVHIDHETKLRTGGVFKFVGQHEQQAFVLGSKRTLALAWGKATLRSFPVSLKIDGELVTEGNVKISNWYLACWPWALLVLALAWRLLD